MNSIQSDLWITLFGTAWEMLTAEIPDISAFILDHKNRKVIADRNAKALLNVERELNYDEFLELISDVATKDFAAPTMLQAIIARQDEEFTAGYLRIRASVDLGIDASLPLASQGQLITALSECSSASLLALIQIEEFGNENLWAQDIAQVITLIMEYLPDTALVTAASRSRIWLFIPSFDSDKTEFLGGLQNAVKICKLTSRSGHNITFTAGCGADSGLPTLRMRSAEFSLFDAEEKGKGTISLYSDDRYEQQKAEYDNMKRFNQLVEDNLFVYHFQPIVSARDGEIVAYEALMRSDKSINMFPLEILGAATKLGRLYDIEKATMRNTLHYISENQEIFKDRKLFVNSIPAHILSSEDWNSLVQDYGELMEKLVVEMTEQTELDNDRLAIIQDRLKRSNIPLAIDDYGTGYSNTSNLLRYHPNYVKIDRSLIEGIDDKPKIQKLVQGFIDFIHDNGYSALAEGVETAEELKTMIRLGSDLIQGYYISKPKPFVLRDITDSLKEEISEINRMYSEEILKVYHPEAGETVDIVKLAENHYGSIFIEADNITLEGKENTKSAIVVTVKDGFKGRLTVRNVVIASENDNGCITLGADTDLSLYIEGHNECRNRGVWVPQTASLDILGSGSLKIHSERMNCYGIGTDADSSYGNIKISCSGRVTVEANGDNTVAIGGGKNAGGNAINVSSGDVVINCSGGNCVGIGCLDGNSVIDVTGCSCSIEISSTNALGIGSLAGKSDIFIEDFIAKIELSGLNLCGIGVLENGSGRVLINNGSLHGVMHGRTANCIGSRKGNFDCNIKSCNVSLYCEGGLIIGIGDTDGNPNITVYECSLIFTFLAKEGYGICSNNGSISIESSFQELRINE